MTLKLREPEPLKLHASEYTGKKLFKFHSGQVFWHASESITDNFLLLVVPCDSLKPQISRTRFLTIIYPSAGTRLPPLKVECFVIVFSPH